MFNCQSVFLLLTIFVMFSVTFLQTTEDPSFCPDPSQLAPYCNCTASSANDVAISCNYVENEEQLEYLFTTTHFPVLVASSLKIVGNNYLRNITKNVFGDIAFENIYFSNDAIEYIDGTAFVNSISNLVRWVMFDCKLLSQGFPFESVGDYSQLNILHLEGAGNFEEIPRVSSQSLQTLYVHNCGVNSLYEAALEELPNLGFLDIASNNLAFLSLGIFDSNNLLQTLYLQSNSIEQLVTGNFRGLHKLTELNLSNNRLSHIEPGAFYDLPELQYLYLNYNSLPYLVFESLGYLPNLNVLRLDYNEQRYFDRDVFLACPRLNFIYADGNNFTFFEVGTFDGMKAGCLELYANSLPTLREDWLRPVLENNNTVDVYDNPLDCGCEMAWLFLNETLITNLKGECGNHTSFQELDPTFFIENC